MTDTLGSPSLATGPILLPPGVTQPVAAIRGLPIESVTDISTESTTGYAVIQRFPDGELLTLNEYLLGEAADSIAMVSDLAITPLPGDSLVANLRFGRYTITVRGIVTETALREMLNQLSEAHPVP